jgi:hypothetical protein
MLGLFAIGASEPEMEIAVACVEANRCFAVGDCLIPGLFLVVDTAAQVVGFCVAGIGGQDGIQRLQRAVGSSQLQVAAGRIRCARGCGAQQGGKKKKKDLTWQRSLLQNSPYWTTLTGTPSLSGWAFMVLSATTSPAFRPLVICTSVRFNTPMVTLTRCRESPSLR